MKHYEKSIKEFSTKMARSKNDRINHDTIERLEHRAKVKPYKRQSKQHIFDDIDDEDDNFYDYV